MAGEMVSEMRESSGLPVGPARAPRRPASTAVALRPQDSLHPLAQLFARSANRAEFLQLLADYARLLVGAELVGLHEKRDEGLALAGLAAPGEGVAEARRGWLPPDEVIEKVLSERLGAQAQLIVDDRQHARLMVPFFPHGEAPVCLTAFLPPERIAFVDPCFTMLHLATQFLVQRGLLSDAQEKEQAFVEATMLVEMFTRCGDAESFKRSLFTLATELEKFFGCQRVAIGTGSKRHCRVHAVSGTSADEKRTIGFSQLGSAMREAIALDQTMVWPGQKTMVREVVVSANHDDLLHSYQAGRLVVLPLHHEASGTTGAVALLWPVGAPETNRKTYLLLEACRPHLGALVGYLKRAKPGGIRGALRRFWRGSRAKRIVTISAAVLGVLSMLLPFTYRVAADCILQPTTRRTVAAPFENRLYRTYAKPGDEVEAGQILAELDGREIRVALAEAIAARSAAFKKRDDAMVSGQPAMVQMTQLEAERLSLEAERLQFRNDNLMIRSPVDGVVLTGDLERSEGVPVTSGQKLFEVAPLDEMLMEIAIPETEVRHVTVGDTVELRLESDGAGERNSTLSSLYPVSEIQDGRNVFVGEALLPNPDGNLRPGMKGSARIETGRRALGWILFHRIYEYLRLKLW